MWRRRNCSSLWPAHNRNRDCQETSILNINTCENGWSNFSANLRVVALNFLELTQFSWLNLWIYFYFSCAVRCGNVMKRTRSLMRPPVINFSNISSEEHSLSFPQLFSYPMPLLHATLFVQLLLHSSHTDTNSHLSPVLYYSAHISALSMLYTPHSFCVPHPFRNPPSQPIATQVPSAAQVGRHSEFPLNY